MEWNFDHAHFLAKDVEALTKYFETVFGMERLAYYEDFKGAPYAILKLGQGDLRIRGYREGDEAEAIAPALVEGLDHIGLAVEDVGAAVAWLEARGAEISQRPARAGIGGRAIAFVRGPGNIRIEICERPAGAS